jgi:dTDP-4-dehydrorhamnose 3,5-epimerase
MLQLLVPVGFGHAFLTLSDVAEIQYKCSAYYTPSAEGVITWNDPDIGVDWPVTEPILSQRDRRGMRLAEYLERPAFRFEEGNVGR